MAKASDNVYPKLIVAEGTVPASPSAGQQKLYLDSADHKLKRVDSGGTVTTIEGGGGTSSAAKMPLDPTTPLDHFSGSALSGWSFAGSYVSGDFTVGDSWARCTTPRVAGHYVYQAPPGSWTTITARMSGVASASSENFGLLAVDSTGAGVGASLVWNGAPDGVLLGNVAAGVFTSGSVSNAAILASLARQGVPHWIRLRKSGTSWFTSASLNGVNWAPETPALTNSSTITRIGFGCWFSSSVAPDSFGLDWFHAA